MPRKKKEMIERVKIRGEKEPKSPRKRKRERERE
jgi:hypothetical protein